jgi:RNA polymerase primary sigma factor
MKGFARSVPQMLCAGRVRAGGERALAEVTDPRLDASNARLLAREEVRQLLARLDERERSVVLAHYGIDWGADRGADLGTGPRADGRRAAGPRAAGPRAAGRREPATYEQVGRLLGLTKQRVRQIEQSALAKLRSAAASSTPRPVV